MDQNNNIELIREYAELSTQVAKGLDRIGVAVEQINHTNILHKTALESNTEAIKNITSYWGTITRWLIIALIILAGVDKASKLLGL